ncbi:MAG: single-stranded-DNA-specific exonuclease RecJ [Proteobacteria bacterium]|nr:single-stranded-DNA-specific exonuclease RecJ [Pseudomonadota bacterium]MBI3497371.1 single-stranded-DNA-specific exonuclease RecJ [Pseudomonadota bacterium]
MVDGGGTASFLGVERSLTGRRWTPRGGSERDGLALAQRLGVPELIGRLLAARGVEIDGAERFLNPTLRAELPDPSHLKDMDTAVLRLRRAVELGEAIVVFGDYDVDGATAAALLCRFLAAVGAKARAYIPDRMIEGYGPNTKALLKLKEDGAAVVITVDCGITAFEPLAAARAAGLEVIVVDHHVAEPTLPDAIAVINPNRLDETSPHGTLAAVGLAFLLAIGLNRALRAAGWFKTRAEPDLMQWLDLVALGTVCDVVPLVGLNRVLVAQGLKVLAKRGNVGLVALAAVARIQRVPDAYHLGFVFGPRVNAGGRVGRADYGTRLLANDDPLEAAELAAELERFNAERKAIEARVQEAAIQMVDASPMAESGLIFAAGEGWHAGVIGIVAGRLKERYNRPAIVVALAEGVGKGSGRSVAGVAMGPAIIAARQAGLLVNGGGHAMAAGFTVAGDKIAALQTFLGERLAEACNALDPKPALSLDGALAPSAATPELVELVQRVGPFGVGNAEPRFAVASARIMRADVVGENHVRCILGGADGGRLKAIAFRSLGSDLGPALLKSRGAALHLAGHLRLDEWQGRREVQLLIDDAAVAG